MANNRIIFRGAHIRHFDFRKEKDGGDCYVRIYVTADLSETVMDEMDWGSEVAVLDAEKNPTGKTRREITESVPGGDLKGALLAKTITLVPTDKLLKTHKLQLDIDAVRDFEFVPVRDKEGEVTNRLLKFVVISSDEDAERIVGLYKRSVGSQPGAAEILYTKQATQLKLGEKTDEDQQSIDDGEAEAVGVGAGSSLASAREMQAGRRKRVADAE